MVIEPCLIVAYFIAKLHDIEGHLRVYKTALFPLLCMATILSWAQGVG